MSRKRAGEATVRGCSFSRYASWQRAVFPTLFVKAAIFDQAAPMPADADSVAVVGGGPAGAAAAVTLARIGVSVTLFERSTPHRPKPCGDALTWPAIESLATLGMDRATLSQLGGTWIDSINYGRDGASIMTTDVSEAPILVVRRDVLDQALRDRAERAGTEVRYQSSVRSVELADRTTLVQWRDRAGRTVSEQFSGLILAAGATAGLARSLDIDGAGIPARAITWYGPHDPDQVLTVDFDRRCAPGYVWHFPVGRDLGNHGVFSVVDTIAAARTQRRVADTLRPGDSDADWSPIRGGRERLWSGRAVRWHSSSGVVSCGDSASLADPLSGEGISAALASGAEAGLAVSRWLEGRDASALHAYSEWCLDYAGRYAPTPDRVMLEIIAGLHQSGDT